MHAFQISEARLDFGERDVITNLLKSRNGTNRGKFEIPTRHIISSINKRNIHQHHTRVIVIIIYFKLREKYLLVNSVSNQKMKQMQIKDKGRHVRKETVNVSESLIKVIMCELPMICLFVCLVVCLLVLNATFNNISIIMWRSVLLVEETGGPGKNHRPAASP